MKTYDNQYNILLKGYDVAMIPEGENPQYYRVILDENGVEVFNDDVLNIHQGEDFNESHLRDIAQAAIDIFEADRGTLGEGAGALQEDSSVMAKIKASLSKKASVGLDETDIEWFNSFKGTTYESQAYDLIKNYLELSYLTDVDSTATELYERRSDIQYQMCVLDLDRIKEQKFITQVIVVKGSKQAYVYTEFEDIENFLDRFAGNPKENEAVKLVKSYLEISEEIDKHAKETEALWDEYTDVQDQMKSLQMEMAYSNALDKVPTTGLEAYPAMAQDVAELMEGVSMDEPLLPTDPASVLAKRSFNEVEPVADRVQELGEIHEGLQTAEVEPPENQTFNEGDQIVLTKEFKISRWGISKVYPKGTKGRIDSLYDRQAEFYMVMLIDPKNERVSLTRVPSKILKKSK
jgi:hypothetical protein